MGEVIPLKPRPPGKTYDKSATGVVDLLRRARAVLSSRDAWHKGGWQSSKRVGGELTGQRCLVQTFKDSDGLYITAATQAVAEQIRKLFPARVSYVDDQDQSICTRFNDHKATTKHDVLLVLDAALEAKGA
jgi:hypothetical protein